MVEEIVKACEIPELPKEVKIKSAAAGSLPSLKISDISEAGIRDMIVKVRTGVYPSLYLAPDEEGEEGYLMMESSPDLVFLQIWDADLETAWSCFDPAYLDSDEQAPIQASDCQSVIWMRNTMKDRDLAAKCVEWYIHTNKPYPGMNWLKATF